jgi:lon-related putative ATP-dependent protease
MTNLTYPQKETMILQLQPEALRKPCMDEMLNYSNSTSLPDELIDQQRAEEALKMGLKIKADGFNVFAAGDEGTGKLTAVKMFLEKLVTNEPTPDDWCYVYNFKDPYQPKKLKLPAGYGSELKNDMKDLVGEAMQALIRTFENEVYGKKRQDIKDKYDKQQSSLTLMINEKAEKESLAIKQTPLEVYTIPLKKGEIMTDEEFDNLPISEKQIIQDKQTRFTNDMNSALKQQRLLEKEMAKEFKKLENEVAVFSITELIEDIITKYEMIPDVVEYLKNVKNDILENLTDFMISQKEKLEDIPVRENEYMKRFQINVLVDNSLKKGSPIVIESNPTYNNLMGSVEKESIMGSLITDFTMIRKGTLHVANGGYLIIKASELFKNFFSWEALKRAIRNKEIIIEEIGEQLGYLTTKTLKPDPIPLHVKVILVGNSMFYHLLYEYDNDFKSLFKVKADFNSEMDRTTENTANFVSFFKRMADKENMLSPDKEALRTLEEFGARFTEDQNKLSMRFGKIADVLREANHYAVEEGKSIIERAQIEKAIEKRIYRSNLIAEKINEMIRKKHILIELSGKKTGQVNALSIIDMGDLMIGKPSKITCTINLGKEGVITVEREAELSGPIHTKGVLILNGYLAEHFFQDKPISLSARLVFEQSYAEIEGDSASSTELYALLSSLSKVPIQQGIAVTGSVNQKGEIQSIGGINEKIEGYFEVCKILGFNGEQGIMIPASNVQNLMLKEEVIEAVRQNNFKIWAVDTIDDGMEVLTGMKAGTIEEEGTINWMVNKTLSEYSQKLKEFIEDDDKEEEPNNTRHWVSDVVMK